MIGVQTATVQQSIANFNDQCISDDDTHFFNDSGDDGDNGDAGDGGYGDDDDDDDDDPLGR